MSETVLAIVGAGLAGAKAAEGARLAGYEGRIVLVGAETALPYERPPLSKAILRGDAEPDSARVHPVGFYAEHGIDVVADEAVALDPLTRRITLASGDSLAYDRAVLATGAEPRLLAIPGGRLDGVHTLRTLEDAVRIRDAIRSAQRVAIIGAGWIGTEVAAAARQMGAEVVLIDPSPTPLHRVLGATVGTVFGRLHADHGVDLRLGAPVSELRGDRDKAVEQVVLSDGSVEPADVVIAGIGALPRTALAETAAAITVDNGIVVDQYLETSIPGVYAAGDVANAWHPHYGRHLRVEHWANALHQGMTAGRNAAGERDVYDHLPYFYSDQYDLGLEYVGHGNADDAVVVRGDLATRTFIAFWHRGGVVSAAMNVNVWDVVDDLKAIVRSRRPLDPARLADPNVALADVR